MHQDYRWLKPMGLAVVCASLLAAGCNQQKDSGAPAAKDEKPSAAAAKSGAAADPGKVLVTIDDKTLTEGDLAKQAEEQYSQVASMVPEEQAESYRKQMRVQAAQSFIVTTLLEREAAKRNITVEDADIEKAIADITKRLPPDMTLDKVLEMEDMTMDTFRARLRKDLRIKKLFDEEMEKSGAVTDQEVSDFYDKQKAVFEVPEQVSARHILIKVDEKDDEAAKAAKKAKIEDLHKKLVGGGDFATLAKENSDCPSAKEGGMLGKFGRGQMVPPFEEAAFSQATNAIGPVIETQFGYHIVQVLEKFPGQTKPIAEVKDQIVDYLKMMKSRQVIPPFIDKLRTEADVKIDPALDQEIQAQKLAEEASQAAGSMQFEPGDEPADEDEEAAPAPAPAAPPVPAPEVPAPPAPAVQPAPAQ